MNEDLLMIKKLEALRAEHQRLDQEIDMGDLDEFTRQRKSKMRLNLRDQICQLEHIVYPDIIA
jgi:hypothetical protein